MSGTFTCPHCNASYPRKPVLVGRVVRCTTCKNAFRLREDGIAEAVASPAPAASEPAATPALAPAAAEAKSTPVTDDYHASPTTPAHAGEPVAVEASARMIPTPAPVESLELTPLGGQPELKPTPTPTPPPGTNSSVGRSARLTAQQLQARRDMAATLTTSISAALKSDAVKAETRKESKRTTRTLKKQEGSVGKLGPAVLTNSGDEDARSNRTWLFGCLGVVVVLALGGWLLVQRSPEREALDQFILVQPALLKEHGDRMSAMQANAWFLTLPPNGLGVTPLQDFGSLRLGKVRAIDRTALRNVATELLKGLEPLPDGSGWATPEPAADQPAAGAKRTLSRKEFTAALTKLGFDAEDQEIVNILILGRTHRDGRNEIGARLLAGNLPESLEILPFSGVNGAILLRGQNRSMRSAYRGTLMRFTGTDWPTGWRVLTLNAVQEP